MVSRIGDLIVWGDKDAVFGEMDTELENFSSRLRSHGSAHELSIPLFICNAMEADNISDFSRNEAFGGDRGPSFATASVLSSLAPSTFGT
jgi:hypothetical protein